jgi:hypothetical protein
MNDFGLKPHSLIFLNKEKGYYPKSTDVYNPNEPNYGNTNFGIGKPVVLPWSSTEYNNFDIRLFYTGLEPSNYSQCRWNPNDNSIPKWWRISWKTNTQICYTAEMLLYA